MVERHQRRELEDAALRLAVQVHAPHRMHLARAGVEQGIGLRIFEREEVRDHVGLEQGAQEGVGIGEVGHPAQHEGGSVCSSMRWTSRSR